jgi:hypothetical protein
LYDDDTIGISIWNPFLSGNITTSSRNQLYVELIGCVSEEKLASIQHTANITTVAQNEPLLCAEFCKSQIRFSNFYALVQQQLNYIKCLCIYTGEMDVARVADDSCDWRCRSSYESYQFTCGGNVSMSAYEPFYAIGTEKPRNSSRNISFVNFVNLYFYLLFVFIYFCF